MPSRPLRSMDRELLTTITPPPVQAMRIVMERMLESQMSYRHHEHYHQRDGLYSDDGPSNSKQLARYGISKNAVSAPTSLLSRFELESAVKALLQERLIKPLLLPMEEVYMPRLLSRWNPAVSSHSAAALPMKDFMDFYKRLGGVGFRFREADTQRLGAVVFINPRLATPVLDVLRQAQTDTRHDCSFEYDPPSGGMICWGASVQAISRGLQALQGYLLLEGTFSDEMRWRMNAADFSALGEHRYNDQNPMQLSASHR